MTEENGEYKVTSCEDGTPLDEIEKKNYETILEGINDATLSEESKELLRDMLMFEYGILYTMNGHSSISIDDCRSNPCEWGMGCEPHKIELCFTFESVWEALGLDRETTEERSEKKK